MSFRRATCSICTELFKSTDENIYSTTCGHLFHFVCLREWQSRSTNCAQCRSYNPQTHKIYLKFEDAPMVDTSELNSLKTQLRIVKIKMHDIQDKLTQSETKCKNLMEKYTTMEQLNKTLQQEMKQFNFSDKDFLELKGQYTENEKCIEALKKQLINIKTQLKTKENELNFKSLEFETLKSLKTENLYGLPPASSSSSAFDNFYSEKCKMLEQKLQHLTEELHKEIRNSTQLSIDKIKLQSQFCIEKHKMKLQLQNLNMGIRSKNEGTTIKANQAKNKTRQTQETRRNVNSIEGVTKAKKANVSIDALFPDIFSASPKPTNLTGSFPILRPTATSSTSKSQSLQLKLKSFPSNQLGYQVDNPNTKTVKLPPSNKMSTARRPIPSSSSNSSSQIPQFEALKSNSTTPYTFDLVEQKSSPTACATVKSHSICTPISSIPESQSPAECKPTLFDSFFDF